MLVNLETADNQYIAVNPDQVTLVFESPDDGKVVVGFGKDMNIPVKGSYLDIVALFNNNKSCGGCR